MAYLIVIVTSAPWIFGIQVCGAVECWRYHFARLLAFEEENWFAILIETIHLLIATEVVTYQQDVGACI